MRDRSLKVQSSLISMAIGENNTSGRMWASMLAERLCGERNVTNLSRLQETIQHYLAWRTAVPCVVMIGERHW